MRYLFFDEEFATTFGGTTKICEFGYVVTNEKFEILEKKILLINPNIARSEWDYTVVRKILTREISMYEKCHLFYEYYDKIRSLIESADYIIGHSIDNDVRALNDDCKRYGLDSINFEFYDVKLLYKEYSGDNNSASVEKIMKDLNLESKGQSHDAECDAYNTMIEFKAIITNLNMSLDELEKICPEMKDSNFDYEIKSYHENQIQKLLKFKENISGDGTNRLSRYSENRRRFLQFLDNVKPKGKLGQKYAGKKISISFNYEENHYRQMLNIVQLITNEGGTFIRKASEADIFIIYDVIDENGDRKYDSRKNIVEELNENGANVMVITLNDFLISLRLTEKELDDMPMISFDFLFEDNAIIKNKDDASKIQQLNNMANKNVEVSKAVNKNACASEIGDLYGDFLTSFLKNNK